MKETFVNNIHELMAANQNQRIKITYLERQKKQMDEYIKDLKESLNINKQALTIINKQGPNNEVIAKLNQQNVKLLEKVNSLYNENRQLSAIYLMECQFKIEERIFSNERIVQFQNRILDLRKYLQDKEASFSEVIIRLKRYEELHQKTVSDKISPINISELEKVTSYTISKICEERNCYKEKLEAIMPQVHRLLVMKESFSNKVNYQRFMAQIHSSPLQQNQKQVSQNGFPRLRLFLQEKIKQQGAKQQQKYNSSKTTSLKASQFNKELIRLFKKEKINNQILEDALNEAIQKNEQLLKINQNYAVQIQRTYKSYEKVRLQKLIFAERIKQFDQGYGGKYSSKKCKDDLSRAMYFNLTNSFDTSVKIDKNHRKSLITYLKDQIDTLYQIYPAKEKQNKNSPANKLKINNYQTQSTFKEHSTIKNQEQSSVYVVNLKKQKQDKKSLQQVQQNDLRKWMIKSASQPRIGYFSLSDDQIEEENEDIQIQQI